MAKIGFELAGPLARLLNRQERVHGAAFVTLRPCKHGCGTNVALPLSDPLRTCQVDPHRYWQTVESLVIDAVGDLLENIGPVKGSFAG